QCVAHVLVAQIPRRDSSTKYGPVIFFRVSNKACVLFSEEKLVGRHAAVAARIFHRTALQLQELFNHGVLTRLSYPEPRGISISYAVFCLKKKKSIAVPRA